MTDLSFQEKSAWGSLLALLVLGALYFSSVWNYWRADQLDSMVFSGFAIGFVVLLVVVLAVYYIVLAVSSPPSDDDERDRLIASKAGHWSGIALGLGVVVIIVQILLDGSFGRPVLDSPVLIANALIAAVLMSAVVELVIKILCYRRGTG